MSGILYRKTEHLVAANKRGKVYAVCPALKHLLPLLSTFDELQLDRVSCETLAKTREAVLSPSTASWSSLFFE
jgi:hypothetical protein